jgi:2-aminoethylphosphonate-pyruvate transaminase
MVAGTAGKCIQGFPGVSFVLVRKGFMERMKTYPKRSWYLNLPHYYEDEERGSIPFTPAVQVCYALDEALDELLEEGVANRISRYKHAAVMIRQRMQELGLKAVLPVSFQSNTITSYYLPQGLTYQALHDRLKEQGYVIYPGKLTVAPSFRIGCIGRLGPAEMRAALAAIKKVLALMGVRSGRPAACAA